MASSCGRENGTLSYLGYKGLSAEDHLGEIYFPMHTTHRWWVTSGSNWDMSSRESA